MLARFQAYKDFLSDPCSSQTANHSRLDLLNLLAQFGENASEFFEGSFEFRHGIGGQHGGFRHFIVARVAVVFEPGNVETVSTLGNP